ncbi:MAG: 3-phosphoshikimate 1-carboxyvinyltransferase [Acholeplasmataceae bacterium]
MRVTIDPRPLEGALETVPSKSLSHRVLIAAALGEEKCAIDHLLEAMDIEATRSALRALGLNATRTYAYGGKPRDQSGITIDAGESGSTLRFLIPVAMLQSEPVTFIGRGRLPKRPLSVYRDAFQPFGYVFRSTTPDELPLVVAGPLQAGHYRLRGDVSSQFLTGLLMALPLVAGSSVIELSTPLESRGYVDLTLDVLKRFNVTIGEEEGRFLIPGDQSYRARSAYVEGDFSQAAFFFVAGTIGKPIELSGLRKDSRQGDRAIVPIIARMGGRISYDQGRYLVTPSTTHGTTIDLGDIPDLGPILMVLAALSKGRTTFLNTERLRIKESDRLSAMQDVLARFGVSMEIGNNRAVIEGTTVLKGNQTFDAFDDHRIVMAIAIAALRADGPVTIEGAQACRKSYPGFFEDYQGLGGVVHGS